MFHLPASGLCALNGKWSPHSRFLVRMSLSYASHRRVAEGSALFRREP